MKEGAGNGQRLCQLFRGSWTRHIQTACQGIEWWRADLNLLRSIIQRNGRIVMDTRIGFELRKAKAYLPETAGRLRSPRTQVISASCARCWRDLDRRSRPRDQAYDELRKGSKPLEIVASASEMKNGGTDRS